MTATSSGPRLPDQLPAAMTTVAARWRSSAVSTISPVSVRLDCLHGVPDNQRRAAALGRRPRAPPSAAPSGRSRAPARAGPRRTARGRARARHLPPSTHRASTPADCVHAPSSPGAPRPRHRTPLRGCRSGDTRPRSGLALELADERVVEAEAANRQLVQRTAARGFDIRREHTGRRLCRAGARAARFRIAVRAPRRASSRPTAHPMIPAPTTMASHSRITCGSYSGA